MSINKMLILIVIVFIILGVLWATGVYLMILSNKAGDKYGKEKIFFHVPIAFGSAKVPGDTRYTVQKIKQNELPSSITNDTYSLGFWLYIEEWDKNKDQHILTKGLGNSVQPSIYLSKKNNNLLVRVDKDSVQDTDVCLHSCIEITDIPIKRWVHFYMNVEGSTINIYINSNLVESRILKVPIINNTHDLIINNEVSQFNGLLSKLLYSNYIKNNKNIKKIYNKGPYGYSITDFFSDIYNKNSAKFSKMFTNAFNLCNR